MTRAGPASVLEKKTQSCLDSEDLMDKLLAVIQRVDRSHPGELC